MYYARIFVVCVSVWSVVSGKCWNSSTLQEIIQLNPDVSKRNSDLNPEKILSGHLYQFGDHEDCVRHLQQQYCMVTVEIQPANPSSRLWTRIQESNRIRTRLRRDLLYVGVCVPKHCEASEVIVDLQDYLTPTARNLGVSVSVSVIEGGCMVQKENPFGALDYATLTVVLALVALVAAGTLFEAITKIVKNEKPPESLGEKILQCFSVLTNYRRLVTLKDTDDGESFRCIQGLRAISIYFVVSGHVLFGVMNMPIRNPKYIEQIYQDFLFAGWINGQCTMGTFLCISGLLLSYFFLKEAKKRGTMGVKEIFMAISLRYLRLTPVYVVVILIVASWQARAGSGPLEAYFTIPECEYCKKNWWTNLLYINNYVYATKSCLIQTWYLAADFQCYVASLLVLVPVCKYPRYAKAILFSALGVWILVPFVQTYIQKLDPVVLLTPENIKHFPQDKTIGDAYISFHCNAGAYTVGVIMGYYFYSMKNSQEKIVLSKKMIAFMYLIGLTVPWTIMTVPFLFYQETYEYNVLIACIFQSLSKVLYAAGIGTIIVVCASGYGWIFNSFLSWTPLQVIGRLSYCIYLIHHIFMRVQVGMMQEVIYANIYWIIRNGIAHLVLATAAALVLCFLAELPASAVMGLLLKSGNRQNTTADTPAEDNRVRLHTLSSSIELASNEKPVRIEDSQTNLVRQ